MDNGLLTIDSSERGMGKRRCSGMRDEDGYIVVETVGAFMLFVFFIASILALINVVAIQAKVHYAITQTAQTLSMYSYFYEITGDSAKYVDGTAIKRIEPDELKDGLTVISTAVDLFAGNGFGTFGKTANDAGSELFTNPDNTVDLYLDGVNSRSFGEEAVRPLIERYLRNGSMSADQYLKFLGVKRGFYDISIFGLDAHLDRIEDGGVDTSYLKFIRKDGSIVITVEYYVPYSFWGLPLPFTNLYIVQSAATRCWLGGEGPRYMPVGSDDSKDAAESGESGG